MVETCTMYMNTHEPKKKVHRKKRNKKYTERLRKVYDSQIQILCARAHTPQPIGLFYACAQLNILTS